MQMARTVKILLFVVILLTPVSAGVASEAPPAPEHARWELPCGINPWVPLPLVPPEDGSVWCWNEIPELV